MAPDSFPDDENGDVLRRMQRNGDDFTRPRDIDFSVVFPSELAAEEFAEGFRRSGFKVSVKQWEAERELPWDVTVTQYMLPTHAGVTEMEETLEHSAVALGGQNDGWGCFAQPTQH